MAWEVDTTEEYDAWFLEQGEDRQASIQMKVEILSKNMAPICHDLTPIP